MEKSTRITTLVMFVFAILLLSSITSCTTDSESDVLYERSADTDASTDQNKKDDQEEDKDVRRKDVTKPKKRKG